MTEKKQSQKTGVNVSLRLKLLVGFTLVFSLVFAAAFYWFYQFGTQMALGRIEEDLKVTLRGVLDGVNGDQFEALVKEGVAGQKILIPRALKAREVLPARLTDAGAEVVIAPVYQNVMPTSSEGELLKTGLRQALEEKSVDMVTFTSSSTVKNFVALLEAASDVGGCHRNHRADNG